MLESEFECGFESELECLRYRSRDRVRDFAFEFALKCVRVRGFAFEFECEFECGRVRDKARVLALQIEFESRFKRLR